MDILTHAALWFSIVSVAIMAGVYFTFSAFVMRSLDAIEAPAGMMAMQSINRIIVQSAFLPIFFASTLVCAALAVRASFDWAAPGALWAAVGGALYVVGMFGVTLVGNVPLNNTLEATPADGPEAKAIWAMYMRQWTRWNHARTLSCIVSLVFLVLAMAQRI
ncbi:MAG: anthrone oxygenase family protein [Pseudomonadota bacterium]